MSLERIQLRKLLQLMYGSKRLRRRILLADVNADRKREDGDEGGGGHFHLPFWTDVRRHISGDSDLATQTQIRIRSNRRRERLYRMLTDAFLVWLNENRRNRNEAFVVIENPPNGSLLLDESQVRIRVDNVLRVQIVGREERFIYPYFNEEPALGEQAVRVALNVMTQALPNTNPAELRVLDVLRSTSFSLATNALRGDETEILESEVSQLVAQWRSLYDDSEE